MGICPRQGNVDGVEIDWPHTNIKPQGDVPEILPLANMEKENQLARSPSMALVALHGYWGQLTRRKAVIGNVTMLCVQRLVEPLTIKYT